MSATMGNATEMIVSIFALRSGLLRVVQLSLLGSVLSNLLLVQGCAFLVGGLKHKQQAYSQAAAKTNVSLLLLAVLALMMPTVLIASNPSPLTEALQADIASGALGTNTSATAIAMAQGALAMMNLEREGITAGHALTLSRFTAVLLLAVYCGLILYQLKTHAHLFEGRDDEGGEGGGDADADADGDTDGESEDDEPPVLGPWGSVGWAVVITVIISVLSEFIVAAIDGAAADLKVPVMFIATILLPIVGNAAEHASAIIFAGRDKMDVALGISVGSSTQIALFVVPLMVVLGWMMGQPLSLDFRVFESLSLLLTVIFSSIVLSTGKGDWLYGVMMIMAYTIISAAFWLQHQPGELE